LFKLKFGVNPFKPDPVRRLLAGLSTVYWRIYPPFTGGFIRRLFGGLSVCHSLKR
jgi:hypothetical protein